MTQRILFLELDLPEPSRTFEAIAAIAQNEGWRCARVMTFEDLAAAVREGAAAIVLTWQKCSNPYFAVEAIMQDPTLCALPLAILFERAGQETLDYFKEYSLTYLVPVTGNHQVDGAKLLAYLSAEQRQIKAGNPPPQYWLRRYYTHLHGERFEEVEKIMQDRLAALMPEHERVFLKGLLLKAQKQFDESMRFLAKGLQLTRQKNNFEPKILHLIGNVAFKCLDLPQARRFLEAAARLSPHNLRRQFLLAQVYFEAGEPETALAAYQRLFAAWPAYPGIHRRMIGLLVERAKAAPDLAVVAELLAFVEERKLDGLYKKLKEQAPPVVATELARIVVGEYRRHGDAAAKVDDHFGALKFYASGIRILPPGERDDRVELLLRCVEMHLAVENPLQAKKVLGSLAELGVRPERLAPLLDRVARLAKRDSRAS
jgi:tetratricopeptide (TPR) repeat protein